MKNPTPYALVNPWLGRKTNPVPQAASVVTMNTANTAFNPVTRRRIMILPTITSPAAMPASPVTICARIRVDMMDGARGG